MPSLPRKLGHTVGTASGNRGRTAYGNGLPIRGIGRSGSKEGLCGRTPIFHSERNYQERLLNYRGADITRVVKVTPPCCCHMG